MFCKRLKESKKGQCYKYNVVGMEAHRNNKAFWEHAMEQQTEKLSRIKLMITRPDGTVSELKNAQFIPAFYLIPMSILEKCGAVLNSIPRAFVKLMCDWDALKIIESDLFRLCIFDCYAYMVWPFLCPEIKYMEIFSGDDPMWRLAHCAPIWINELEKSEILPTIRQMHEYRHLYTTPLYASEEDVEIYMNFIVPNAVKRDNLGPVMDAVREMRCFEDFDYRDSNQKTDFYRKWYHSRTQKAECSLEGYQEHCKQYYDDIEWEIPDPISSFEEEVEARVDVNKFLSKIKDKDKQILQMRAEGYTNQEIADRIGYKTHSAVVKRIKKLGKMYQDSSGLNFGF